MPPPIFKRTHVLIGNWISIKLLRKKKATGNFYSILNLWMVNIIIIIIIQIVAI